MNHLHDTREASSAELSELPEPELLPNEQDLFGNAFLQEQLRAEAESVDVMEDASSEMQPLDVEPEAPAGAPLPHRDALESAFGRSLAGLQVHQGAEADEDLEAWGAEAAHEEGRLTLPRGPDAELVAEEVAHHLQSEQASGAPTREVTSPEEAAEREADEVAGLAAHGEDVEVHESPTGRVARRERGEGWEPVGTDEDMQTALDAHKRIRLAPGVYEVSEPIRLSSGMRIRGAGRNKTVVKWTGGKNRNGAVFMGGSKGQGISDVRIRDLSIRGGSSADRKRRLRARNGTMKDGKLQKLNPEGSERGIKRMSGIKIIGQKGGEAIRLSGLGIRDLDRYGIHVKNARKLALTDNLVRRCGTSRAYDHGVYTRRVDEVVARGGRYSDNSGAGMKVADAERGLRLERRKRGGRRRPRMKGNRCGLLASGVGRMKVRGADFWDNDEHGIKLSHEDGRERSGRVDVRGSRFRRNGASEHKKSAVRWPGWATRERTRQRWGADGRGHGWRDNEGVARRHRPL